MPPLRDGRELAEPDNEQVTIGPKTKLNLATAVTLAGSLVWVGWVSSEIKTIKDSLGAIARQSSELVLVKAQLDTIDKTGTAGLIAVRDKLNSFAQAIDAYRANGSPGEEKRMIEIERRLAAVENALSVHEALDNKRMGVAKP